MKNLTTKIIVTLIFVLGFTTLLFAQQDFSIYLFNKYDTINVTKLKKDTTIIVNDTNNLVLKCEIDFRLNYNPNDTTIYVTSYATKHKINFNNDTIIFKCDYKNFVKILYDITLIYNPYLSVNEVKASKGFIVYPTILSSYTSLNIEKDIDLTDSDVFISSIDGKVYNVTKELIKDNKIDIFELINVSGLYYINVYDKRTKTNFVSKFILQ